MYEFRKLDQVSLEVLHNAFVEAFSDYQVRIDLPYWKFEQMMKRRGFVPEKSLGAFKDGRLVGFILNGCRSWNGQLTAYDLGTGVIPEHRKQGLTTSMFLRLAEQLRAEGVKQYLLEVLQQNKAAFELYKKQGFEITRPFCCYKLDKSIFRHKGTHTIEHLDSLKPADWELFDGFMDFRPSWQNSTESICSVPDSFICSVVRMDNRIVGYGIIEKKTGDIPQLSVDRNYRGKGIGRSILADLISNTDAERVALINVDDSADSIKHFLLSMGFEHFVDQYEMLLKLTD